MAYYSPFSIEMGEQRLEVLEAKYKAVQAQVNTAQLRLTKTMSRCKSLERRRSWSTTVLQRRSSAASNMGKHTSGNGNTNAPCRPETV
jgi:hypothetical protein